jgi:hypothetical protein
MDRINETIYPAGLSGVSHMILWVKFSAERRGIVVLQGMDIMRVHTPNKQILAGFKSPQRGGVWTRLRIK